MKKLLCFTSVFLSFFSMQAAHVLPGVEVFLKQYVSLVKNQRVALLTNQTGVDSKRRRTLDLLAAHPGVNLTLLFAPEHGVRGNLAAGKKVPGGRDSRTGLPVRSLYGGNDHRPDKVDLAKIDTIIYDIQDTGCRAYTYIWTLAEVMAAAGVYGKRVIVFDRPDPFGGKVVDGPVTEKNFLSFIGLYPIPRVYGMTVGELALYLNREHNLNCHLTVIPMHNYRRGMRFEQTGLPWIPTSPRIPDLQTLYCFSTTGSIGVLGGTLNIGGGQRPLFRTVAAPFINGKDFTLYMNRLKLPGVFFTQTYYKTPLGTPEHGIQINVSDPTRFMPVTTEMAIISYIKRRYPKQKLFRPASYKSYDKAMGNSKTRISLMYRNSHVPIINRWSKDLLKYKQKRQRYLLYK